MQQPEGFEVCRLKKSFIWLEVSRQGLELKCKDSSCTTELILAPSLQASVISSTNTGISILRVSEEDIEAMVRLDTIEAHSTWATHEGRWECKV